MTTAQPPLDSGGSSKQVPRYVGFSGALAFGALLFCITLGVGLLGAADVLLSGERMLATRVLFRIIAIGILAGGAATIGRWVCRARVDRLLTVRPARGDLGILAALLAVLLYGIGLTHPGQLDHSARQIRPLDILLYGVGLTRPSQSAPAGDDTLAVGQRVEIAGPTLDGSSFHLDAYRGKVVLVDFWATWCGPCLAELPNLQAVHEEFHADGLEVVSVSLDNDRASLTRFLATRPLPWPQIFFDEAGKRGWHNPLVRRYGIHGIPRLLVVDREGRLAADDVRGGQVRQAVAEALGLGVPWWARLDAALGRLAGLFLGTLLGASPVDLILCGWGAALLGSLLERAVRRAFTRRHAPAL